MRQDSILQVGGGVILDQRRLLGTEVETERLGGERV